MKALTPQMLQELRHLEVQLQDCVRTADIDRADRIAKKIKTVFGANSTHHRFLRNLNSYAECEIEAHQYRAATSTLSIVRARASDKTRVFLEAVGLQTVAYFRLKKYEEAKSCARIVLQSLSRIKSDKRRRQFQKRFIQRLQEECILASLIGASDDVLDAHTVHEDAVKMVQKKNYDEILNLIESQLPGETIVLLKEVTDYSILQLPPIDRKFLPAPDTQGNVPKLGSKCVSAIKRIAWKTFCHSDSEIYKLWSQKLPKVYGPGYFAAALAAGFKEWNIGFSLIAAGIVAIAIKYGCDEFCTTFKPDSLIIPISEKDKD